jgi:hypothetical protein
MEINGSHVIQKRDLLAMLDGLPEAEHIAVELDGLPEEQSDDDVLPMPEAPVDLDDLRVESERAGRPKSAAAYIEALEERIRDLETSWPSREAILSERGTALDNVRDHLVISSVRRSHGRTHLVCGI